MAENMVVKSGMAGMLNVRFVSITKEEVVAEMHIGPGHLNINDQVNGGALMAFADLLGAAGAVENRPPGYRGGTLESKTNFFTPGKGPVIHGKCIPLHRGRTTSVWQSTLTNADGKVVAMVTQTQMQLAVG